MKAFRKPVLLAARSVLQKKPSLGTTRHSDHPRELKYPVVLVRGLGRSAGFWLDFPDLVAEHAGVHLLDLRGMGRSPGIWGAGSVKSMGLDIVETLKKRNLLPCHLVGLSLGGMACVEAARILAEQHVDPREMAGNLVSLTVIASSARAMGERRISRKAFMRILPEIFKKVPRNGQLAQFLVSSRRLAENPELPALWDRLAKTEGFRSVATLRQLLAAAVYDARKALRVVQRPMLCVVSKGDQLVSWRNTPRLWEMNANAEMVILDDSGHDIPTEKPRELRDILVDFCSRSEALAEHDVTALDRA